METSGFACSPRGEFAFIDPLTTSSATGCPMSSLVRGECSPPFSVLDGPEAQSHAGSTGESPERGKPASPDCRTLPASGLRPLLWARYEREARTRSVVHPPQNDHLGSRGRASREARRRGLPPPTCSDRCATPSDLARARTGAVRRMITFPLLLVNPMAEPPQTLPSARIPDDNVPTLGRGITTDPADGIDAGTAGLHKLLRSQCAI